MTLDQYRDAANQICADAAEQGRALPPLEEDSSSEEIQSFLDATLALGDRTSEELQGLNPPAAQRDELREEFIRPFMEQLALAKVFMSVQRRSGEDSSELEPLRAQLGELRTERAEYAKANGLEACAT